MKVSLFFLLVVFVSISDTAPIRKDASREEAIKIALESTGELQAQRSLVNKIQADLELIRYVDPAMKKIIHQGKWKPGQLLSEDISESQLMEISKSEFKPLEKVDASTSHSPSTLLVFKKSYHPERLSNLLKLRFGINAKPHFEESSSNDQIFYNDDLSTYYFNPVNGENCEDGCYGQFSVSFNPQEYNGDDDNKV